MNNIYVLSLGAISLRNIWIWIKNAANAVVLLLPDSPFVFLEEEYVPEAIRDILPYLNWFIPIGSIITIIELWLTAVAVYYVYQTILRWVKAIE